jgi:hypothetical protein
MAKFLFAMSSSSYHVGIIIIIIIIIIITPTVAFSSLGFVLILQFTLVKSKLQYVSCNLELY